MKKISIKLTESPILLAKLNKLAKEKGVSVKALINASLERRFASFYLPKGDAHLEKNNTHSSTRLKASI